MKAIYLRDMDPEDLEALLMKVEKSFGMKFLSSELVHIATFEELCDHILSNIQRIHANDCTTQQAFYKLRESISSTFKIDKQSIVPEYAIEQILPNSSKRRTIKLIEKTLGFKLNILRPPHWLTAFLVCFLLISCMCLFIKWQFGVLGILSSLIGIWLSNNLANEVDLKTVGQIARKMTRDNYLKSRRDPNTLNPKEIEIVLIGLLEQELNL